MSAPVQASEGAELPPLTEAELVEIEARANAATPAWTLALHIDEPRAIVSADDMSMSLLALDRDGMAIFDRVEDARFAAEARSDVPRLLADLRRAQKRIADEDGARDRTCAAIGKTLAAATLHYERELGAATQRWEVLQETGVKQRAEIEALRKQVAKLERDIAATVAAHREDQRRADELARVPGSAPPIPVASAARRSSRLPPRMALPARMRWGALS